MNDLDFLVHLGIIAHHLATLQQLRPSPSLQMALSEIEKVLKTSALPNSK